MIEFFVLLFPAVYSFPHSAVDPFSPLGSWHRRGPPCGLPPFISKLPEDAQEKVRMIWRDYREGDECTRQLRETRSLVHALPEDIREKIFSGRCGPSFLRNVSSTVRKEFKSVWFDSKMTLEQKELALKKLAFSLLSGEGLAHFVKWNEELQERKAELERNIAALSPQAKNALEEWKAIRQEERDFLARLPKEIKDELKTLCGWWPKINLPVPTSTPAANEPSTTPADVETTTPDHEKEFAVFLDFVMPEETSNDSHCAFYL